MAPWHSRPEGPKGAGPSAPRDRRTWEPRRSGTWGLEHSGSSGPRGSGTGLAVAADTAIRAVSPSPLNANRAHRGPPGPDRSGWHGGNKAAPRRWDAGGPWDPGRRACPVHRADGRSSPGQGRGPGARGAQKDDPQCVSRRTRGRGARATGESHHRACPVRASTNAGLIHPIITHHHPTSSTPTRMAPGCVSSRSIIIGSR